MEKNQKLSQDDALIVANVAIQMIKGMIALCAEIEPRRRAAVIREFERAITNYLTDALHAK